MAAKRGFNGIIIIIIIIITINITMNVKPKNSVH